MAFIRIPAPLPARSNALDVDGTVLRARARIV